MEVNIKTKELLKGLGRIQNVVEKTNIMPILSHALIETKEKNIIEISGTDFQTGMKISLNCEVFKKGGISIEVKRFYDILKEITADSLNLETNERNLLIISWGKAHYNLMGMEQDAFPSLPKFDDSIESTSLIPVDVISNMIKKTIFAVSNDSSRPSLCGVYFEEDKEKEALVAVATDGFRLSMMACNLSKDSLLGLALGENGIILSKKGVTELKRLTDEGGERHITVGKIDNFLGVKKNDVELFLRIIDGEFPDYRKAIPLDLKYQVCVEKVPLLSILRRAGALINERIKPVLLDIEPGGNMIVSAEDPQVGDAKEEIPIEYQGEEKIALRFNAAYFLEFLQVIDSPKIILGFKDPGKSVLLEPYGQEEGFKYVMMPLRISGE